MKIALPLNKTTRTGGHLNYITLRNILFRYIMLIAHYLGILAIIASLGILATIASLGILAIIASLHIIIYAWHLPYAISYRQTITFASTPLYTSPQFHIAKHYTH